MYVCCQVCYCQHDHRDLKDLMSNLKCTAWITVFASNDLVQYFSKWKLSESHSLWLNSPQNFIHSAWDLLAHTSDKRNHVNGAGRQVGNVPEQSAQNDGNRRGKRGVPLAWIIANRYFDQLCDNFHTIWQLSAGQDGIKRWIGWPLET